MKKNFVIDWILFFVFVLSALSGVGLHIVGHGNNHELWRTWAIVHVLTSWSLFAAAIFHVIAHWGWYKGFVRNGVGKKSRITAALSVVLPLMAVTGIVLLSKPNGGHSGVGLWHYKIGIVAIFFSVVHILKRGRLLYKTLKK